MGHVIQNGTILDLSHALMLPKIGNALLFGSSLPAEKVAPGVGIRLWIAGALLLGVGLPEECKTSRCAVDKHTSMW